MSELRELGKRLMPRCLELAGKARGKVSPNPMVGSVVLSKSGRVVGEGFHKKAGAAHGEAAALRAAGSKAKGGTVIVNLEPCNHHGRTGPCVEAILAAGVRRVVYGASDPIAGHGGGGRALRRAGLEVIGGVMRRECEVFNRIFFTSAWLGRPHVVGKAATSLDGKTASAHGESKWITGEKARADGRTLRGDLDVICVGIGTVLADDPQLTARRRGLLDPLRVIFDGRLRTPPSAKALPALIVTSDQAPARKAKRLESMGAEILRCPGAPDPALLLETLHERGRTSVLVEGGATLLSSFLSADLIDELRLYQAPIVLGPAARPWLTGQTPTPALAEAPGFIITEQRKVGQDLAITAIRRR